MFKITIRKAGFGDMSRVTETRAMSLVASVNRVVHDVKRDLLATLRQLNLLLLIKPPLTTAAFVSSLVKPQLATARLRLHASMMSICLTVCLYLSVCRQNAKKTRFFSKTKQFRAMMSIDNL